MAFRLKQTLNRHTKFISTDDRDFEPLSLVGNHKRHQSSLPEDPTAETKQVESRVAYGNQESVHIHSLLETQAVKSLEIPITSGSLWDKYKRINMRNLGGSVFAVCERSTKEETRVIRNMRLEELEVLAFRKRWLSHDNLCKTYEVFEDGGQFYCVMEPAVVTLLHVCRCPKYPSEEQLVTITKQMLAGIAYLSSEGLFHSCLGTSNVVINAEGVVKLNKLEYCKKDSDCSLKNSKSFGRTTMMLMDKFASDEGEICVRQRHDWSQMAMDFLASTRTWTPDALLQHDFMQQACKINALKLHVELVQQTVRMKDDAGKQCYTG